MSLVLDKTGIHYNAHAPSDLETLLATATFDHEILERSRRLIVQLTSTGVTKYNLAARGQVGELPEGRPKILVPGQVENDAAVLQAGTHLRTSLDVLHAVREANPDAFIIFKPYPDVVSGQRPGLWKQSDALRLADRFVQDVSIVDAIEACDEIHVLSSLAGFEGLLRGKKVTCHGLPFYAGWGLTNDVLNCQRRQRTLTLEQLVAGSMILYPHYLDPVTQLPCGPEVVVSRILEERTNPQRPGALIASRRVLGQFRRVLRQMRL